ncbi:MAG: hypothetical protein QXG39_00090 [Candidatus Aenigmatarchaeota archaeon]
MKRFKITTEELILAFIFFILAFFFTSREWLLFLNRLDPLSGWLIYEIIVVVTIFCLAYAGLVVARIEIKSPLQILGSFMIVSAFFMIFNWENPYVQYVTTGGFQGASNVFYQTEDGVSWWIWSNFILKGQDPEVIRIFAFPVTVFILVFVGVFLVREVELYT